jgi:CspA family cold shock protein
LSRDGGRVRKSRGRGRSEDEGFGGGDWSPPADFGRPAGHAPARPSGFGAGYGGGGSGPESQATVKWFNPEKGFGFVEVAEGGGDAFLHVSVLERAGAKLVEPGATLRVRTGPGQKGLQVTEVLEITGGGAPPAGSSQPRSRDRYPPPPAEGDGEEMQGVVKWYDAAKGFGFVAPADGSRDVFVHATALERSGLRALADGQTVRMRVVQGRKGPEVATIAID